MDDLLTTRQVQDILKVERITIYRMLQDGRIKGVKLGHHWRFPRREVERLVGMGISESEPASQGMEAAFPTHCVQAIQDLFSEVGRVSALVIDLQGEPLTELSRPCGFCQAILANPAGQAACRASWKALAGRNGNKVTAFTCHAGLQYLAAPVVDEGERVGWFLVGQFYWQAPSAPEETERIRKLAFALNLQAEPLQQAARSIPRIDAAQHALFKTWPSTAARAVESILRERTGFIERLRQIANLTQIP